jgi:integrase
MSHSSHLRRRNGRYSFRIVLPSHIALHCARRETHLALRTTDVYTARVLSSTIRQSFRGFAMTLGTASPDTYAHRLDRWIEAQKLAIAEHIALEGVRSVFSEEEVRRLDHMQNPWGASGPSAVEAPPDTGNGEFEAYELDYLMLAIAKLGIGKEGVKRRSLNAVLGLDPKWRETFAPLVSEAREAIAPDVIDPTNCAVLDREIMRRLHEVSEHFGAVYRGEDGPHPLMSEPICQPPGSADIAVASAVDVKPPPNQAISVAANGGVEAPPAPPPDGKDGNPRPRATISELLPVFFSDVTPKKAERYSAVGWTLATALQARSSLKLLLAICGDKPPIDLIAADGAEFKRKARQLPAKYGQSDVCAEAYATNDIDALIAIRDAALNESKMSHLHDRMSDKTYNKHYSALSKFWKWCIDNSVVPKGTDFFLKGHFIKLKDKKAKYVPIHQRTIWGTEELEKLFSSTIFTGMQEHRLWKDQGEFFTRDTRYWMIVIGALHGMRANEIAQLKVKHVCIHRSATKGDIPYFDLTAVDLELKEVGSAREVPLHRHMLALSFLEDRVIGRQPDEFLFPEIEAENALGKRSAPFGGFFQRFTDHLGIDKVFHELRHTCATLLFGAGVPISHCEAIVGHESPGRSAVFAGYNAGLKVEALKEYIDKIEMPFDIELMVAMARKATPWRKHFAGRLDRQG